MDVQNLPLNNRETSELKKFAVSVAVNLQSADYKTSSVSQPNPGKSAQKIVADAQIIYDFLIK